MTRFARWWAGSLLLIVLGWVLSADLGEPLRRDRSDDTALLTSKGLPAPQPLDEADLLRVRQIRLWMDEDRFAFLFSHPPLSLNSFQDVRVIIDDHRRIFRGRFRVRGGHSWHWLREKPSFRLRFSPRRKVWNRETLDFVNPEDAPMQANLLADFLALRVGVPAAVSRFAWVRLNDRPLGLYHFTDRLDDQLFEQIGVSRRPVAEGNRRRAEMWRNPSLWDIHSGQTSARDACRKALTAFLEAIRPPVSASGIRRLGQHIDLASLASWSALLTVIGSLQADELHNQNLSFDPATGKFVPLVADSTGFGTLTNHGLEFKPTDSRIWPNEFLTPITNAAFRNPTVLAARNRALHAFLQGEAHPDRIASLARRLHQAITPFLVDDRHRGALINIPYLEFPLRLPTSQETVASSVAAMANWYSDRAAYLHEILASSAVVLHPVRNDSGSSRDLFFIEVFGHVPVIWELGSAAAAIRFDDDRDGTIAADSPPAPALLRLYPGVREGIPENQPWLRLETRMFPFALLPASQSYLLGVEKSAAPAVRHLLETGARNGITGSPCAVIIGEETPEVPGYPPTAGLHPWALDPEAIIP